MQDNQNMDFTTFAEDEFDVASIFGGNSQSTEAIPEPPQAPELPQKTEAVNPPQKAEASAKSNVVSLPEQREKSLFEKPPIFTYGSAKEEILDVSQTFEELRIAKAEDFPELSEGKKVSWTIEYGKTTKAISDPKGTTIQSVKEEIEGSKAFLDGLKKAKDKNPNCLVKPKVTAQSKGISSYKGFFPDQASAVQSDKAICFIPSQDGKIYEMRKNEMGQFITMANKVSELKKVQAGFIPALPPIPQKLWMQVLGFFQSYMQPQPMEVLVHIYWDRVAHEYVTNIPKQFVSNTKIIADMTVNDLDEKRYLHYADIHSHNTMDAKFSPQDDADEKATRVYLVVGNLDQFFPTVTARVSVGGNYQSIHPGLVLESLSMDFPNQWRDQVTTPLQSLCNPFTQKRLEVQFL